MVVRQTDSGQGRKSMDDSSGDTIHNFFRLFGLKFFRVKKKKQTAKVTSCLTLGANSWLQSREHDDE